MPHMHQAASVGGVTASIVGGAMAQIPNPDVGNAGIALGITGVLVGVLNGLYPYWKTYWDTRTIRDDIAKLQAAADGAERKLVEAKADADRRLAEQEERHRKAEAEAREKRHADRNTFNDRYYKQQNELMDAMIKIARLEGTHGRAINRNAEAIVDVARAVDPSLSVWTGHVDPTPPIPQDDDEPYAGPGAGSPPP